MRNTALTSVGKLILTISLSACALLLSAPVCFGADGPSEGDLNQTRPRRVTKSAESYSADPIDVAGGSPVIAYALYRDSVSFNATVEPTVTKTVSMPTRTLTGGSVALPPTPSPVVSTAPMTAGEKGHYWLKTTILSPGAYGSAIFSGLFHELQDDDDFKKDTTENYFADSMTRAARSMAFKSTAGFLEKFFFASIFRQDPRYHRSGKKGAGGRIGYAVSRVFVTQGDRCGCNQFNASFLLGGAGASGLAAFWERPERGGPMHAVRRWGSHIWITAFFNIVKEFVGGQ